MTDAAPQDLAFPDEAFRAQPPAAGEPRPFHLPPVSVFTLASGITVYLVEQHALPLVSLDLSFAGGSALDPAGKAGLASICMAMLTEGTDELDKLAYAERLADTASSIGGYATDDTFGVTLSSLTRHLPATFAQLAATLRRPGFRARDFDRMIRRRSEGVRQARKSPASVASRIADAVLYGPAHPFGGVTTEASLAALTVEDCRALAARALVPGGAQLFVVGDLTEAQIRACFDGPELAGWTGQVTPPEIPPPETRPGRIFFVDVPGAAQSTVSYLQLGPARTSPGFFARQLLGNVLGGGFTSRLNMNLREDKGYTYGARGGFSYTRHGGAFTASAPVAAGATYQTIRELEREVHAIRSAPITAEELDREQRGAILGLPGRFATAQAALGQYRALVYFGLPLDHFDHYAEGVRAVTPDDVLAAARADLRPEAAVYVVVGDGAAPAILRDGDRDVPYVKAGRQLTLREALGDCVELDSDGHSLG